MRNWLIVVVLVVMASCSSRPDGVMSQREMRNFLTELHVLEGLIDNDPVISADDRLDVYYYNYLFTKHGISKADFDSSLVYYTKQPKRFERIYAGVIRNLDKLEEDVIAGKYERIIPDSILRKPEFYNLPALDSMYQFAPDSTRTSLAFAVKNSALMTQDIYHLRFRLRREPADSTEGGYAALRIHYADGEVDSLVHPTYNDSVLRKYHFLFRAKRNLPVDSLSGVLLGAEKVKGKFKVYLDSITLQREYRPFLQDSLRNQLDSVPPAIISPDTVSLSQPATPTSNKDKIMIRKENE